MKALENASALASTFLRMVESRLELFGLELRQERLRLVWTIGLVCLASGSFLLAGVGIFVLLAVALPTSDRVEVLSWCVGLLALICLLSVVLALRLFLKGEMPFRETRDELKKDAQCLSSALKKSE